MKVSFVSFFRSSRGLAVNHIDDRTWWYLSKELSLSALMRSENSAASAQTSFNFSPSLVAFKRSLFSASRLFWRVVNASSPVHSAFSYDFCDSSTFVFDSSAPFCSLRSSSYNLQSAQPACPSQPECQQRLYPVTISLQVQTTHQPSRKPFSARQRPCKLWKRFFSPTRSALSKPTTPFNYQSLYLSVLDTSSTASSATPAAAPLTALSKFYRKYR